MNKIELKTGLHSLIDRIDNVNLLNEYYNELKRIVTSDKGKIWDTLSEEQKKEVLLSYEESEDDANLIDNEVMMKKYKK